MSSHPQIHANEYGLSDLLQHIALVGPQTALLKDAGLQTAFEFEGADLDARNPEFITGVRDEMGRHLTLGKGWVLETHVLPVPSTEYPVWGTFPSPVAQLIEEERRQNYTLASRYWQIKRFLVLTYFPPSARGEKTKGWFYETPEAKGLAQQALDFFEYKVAEFESSIASVLRLRRLGVREVENDLGQTETINELLSFVRLCIEGEERPVLHPSDPTDLDFLLTNRELLTGSYPMLGNQHLRVLSLDGFPEQLYPNSLRCLEELSMPFRLQGRSILLSAPETIALHDFNRKRHGSKVVPFLAQFLKKAPTRINTLAQEKANEAAFAMSLAEKTGETWAHYSARLVLLREDAKLLQSDIEKIREALRPAHIGVRVETLNSVDAWCGSLPGHSFYDVRQVPLRSFNIASLSPLHHTWPGYRYHPSPMFPAGSSPLLVATSKGQLPRTHNHHVVDVGHTAFFGPTGAGKTTVFGLHELSLLRYPGARVFVFDRRRTQYVLCKAVQGKFYDFGRNTTLRLCPLYYLDDPSDRAWAAGYLEDLCRLNGLAVTADHRQRIGETLERMSKRPDRKHRSLTHFINSVQDREIAAALQLYTIGNPISAELLDGEDDEMEFTYFNVFEMYELMNMNPAIAAGVLLCLFRYIERSITPETVTGIYIDEARKQIRHESFAPRISDGLKELRNRGAFMMLAFQELEDSATSDLQSAIDQQCMTKIYLPNPAAAQPKTRKAYQDHGLNERQIDMIQQGRPKQDYFVRQIETSETEHFSHLTFDLDRVALSFLGANRDVDRSRVDELEALYGSDWPVYWLRERHLPDWADYLEQMIADSRQEEEKDWEVCA
jgi:type IV secretion/conjugal transfer VirB4 family ATPase